jgi:hypothetical protein
MKTNQSSSTSNQTSTHHARSALIGVSAVALLLQLGCAMERRADLSTSDPPPPPRATLGRIGVATHGTLPEFNLQIPDSKGEVVRESVGRAALGWLAPWDDPRDSIGTALVSGAEQLVEDTGSVIGPYTAPFAGLAIGTRLARATVGEAAMGVYGVVKGLSEREVSVGAATLTRALSAMNVEESLRRQLLPLVREKSGDTVAILEKPLAEDRNSPVPGLVHADAPIVAASIADRGDRFVTLSDEAVDTILALKVVSFGLTGKEGINPLLSLDVIVQATLIRAKDGQPQHRCFTHFTSERRKFTEWAAHDADLFRLTVARGIGSTADQIVEQLGLHPVGVDLARTSAR